MRYCNIIAYLIAVPFICFLAKKRLPKEDKLRKYTWLLILIHTITSIVFFIIDESNKNENIFDQISMISFLASIGYLFGFPIYIQKKYMKEVVTLSAEESKYFVEEPDIDKTLVKYGLDKNKFIPELFQIFVNYINEDGYEYQKNIFQMILKQEGDKFFTYNYQLESYIINHLVEKEDMLKIQVDFEVSYQGHYEKDGEVNNYKEWYIVEFVKEKDSTDFKLDKIVIDDKKNSIFY